MTITKVMRERVTLATAGLAVPCPICQRDVEILNSSQAAAILEVEEESLGALITSGEVHEIRTVSGSLAVCKDSLWQRSRVVGAWPETKGQGKLP